MSESKKRSPLVDYLVYLAVRLVVLILQMLSISASLRLANALAWLAYRFNRRHRLVAMENLAQAFPELDEAQRDELVRDVYRHFLTVMVTMVHLPRCYHIRSWRRYFDMGNGAPLVAALLSGRPVLLVTGHFGNWEMGGYTLGTFGFSTWAIARPLDNPYLDRFLGQFRQRTGQSLLAKHGDFEKMQGILEQGGVIATLGDQDAGQRGLFVDFFGRPASTHKAIALMALEYNVLMVVLGIPRVAPPLKHQLVVTDVIDPAEYAGRPDAVRAITVRFTQALEALIRQYPEQYFWLHRRWKHQPKVREKKKAA
jgi:KDO2-lipid IV(A) lauroyltransferase